MQDAQNGKLPRQPGQTMFTSFEYSVNKLLNNLTNTVGEVARETIDESNNIVRMIDAGSKGSPYNILQIMCCVAQQNVEGKRVAFGFNRRTLPHFQKDDYSAMSR